MLDFIFATFEVITNGAYAILLSVLGLFFIGMLASIPVILWPEYKKFEDSYDQYELRRYHDRLKLSFLAGLVVSVLFLEHLLTAVAFVLCVLMILLAISIVILIPFLIKIGLDEKNELDQINQRQVEEYIKHGVILSVFFALIFILF